MKQLVAILLVGLAVTVAQRAIAADAPSGGHRAAH